ncbi:hypothetical protein ABG768_009457 [Culter alburnus]|uniref:Uncharacterized protein n=1 Tax=Culter alburnus TaxID=194366 RepID=A0AAW1ZCZ2_CULAL
MRRAGGVCTSAWSCGHEHGITDRLTDPPPSTESPSSLAFVTPSSSSPSDPCGHANARRPPPRAEMTTTLPTLPLTTALLDRPMTEGNRPTPSRMNWTIRFLKEKRKRRMSRGIPDEL